MPPILCPHLVLSVLPTTVLCCFFLPWFAHGVLGLQIFVNYILGNERKRESVTQWHTRAENNDMFYCPFLKYGWSNVSWMIRSSDSNHIIISSYVTLRHQGESWCSSYPKPLASPALMRQMKTKRFAATHVVDVEAVGAATLHVRRRYCLMLNVAMIYWCKRGF